MKIPYFCCIGAELKRYAKDFDFMNQVYLYKVPVDDTIEEVLAQDYFQAISDTVLQDDLVYIYEASAETLHSCRFDKQNGHITAVPLASDETLTGAVTTIIHDNLTPNKLLKSDENGKVAASDLNAGEIANTDLSNLTAKGKNIANWSSNVTNCITTIPQDIKLELDDGYLVIKSGSKFYKPNGSGVFDTYIVSNDIRWTGSSTGTFFVFWTGNAIDIVSGNNCYSGSTAPTGISQYSAWYDTTNNVIKKTNDSGSTWQGAYTLPICMINSVSGSGVVSIKQTFNGFGFIGSTVFVLPGVKGLIPNGRNGDGTLKSTSLNISSVITQTFTGTANTVLAITSNQIITEGNGIWHDAVNNYNYYSSNSTTTYDAVIIGTATLTSGKVSNFCTKKTLAFVNEEDVANLTMPSEKYIDLTLGTTGTNYVAPADGYFTINKGGSDGEWIYMLDNSTGANVSLSYAASVNARLLIPVARGKSIQIQYTASGTTNYFRFIYANGAK